jgi:hypothetical protein
MSPQDQAPTRSRLTVDLAPAVSLLLDHVSEVTGSTKTQIINAALLDALPSLLERADTLQKRAQVLSQPQTQKKR